MLLKNVNNLTKQAMKHGKHMMSDKEMKKMSKKKMMGSYSFKTKKATMKKSSRKK